MIVSAIITIYEAKPNLEEVVLLAQITQLVEKLAFKPVVGRFRVLLGSPRFSHTSG